MTSNNHLGWALEEKPVIVTGASSGIGAATVRLLGTAGAWVVLVGRDAGRLEGAAAEVRDGGGRAEIAVAELEDESAGQSIVDRALDAYGGIHGIVHSASLFDPMPIEETTLECIERQWRTNVAAPLALTQAALPHLGPGSSVVFVGSTVGTVGFPGCAAYTATKGAVEAVTRALAVELAPQGIRVNIVIPGYVRTPMLQPHLDANDGYEEWIVDNTPLARIGGPDELAPSIVFLLSDLSAYVDGTTLITDGGWAAR
jgi:NAD(P)-dependent dehydrogenase (short-subunit alcohol dehydrogenase family)